MHALSMEGATTDDSGLMALMTRDACACGNLRRASRAITQRYDAALAPSGLTTPQFSLLALMAHTGPLTLGTLADHAGMDRTTLTRDLGPLTRAGFVAMAAGEIDRRTRVVQITEAGEAVLNRALPLWREAQAAVVVAFGPERFSGLVRDLKGITALVR